MKTSNSISITIITYFLIHTIGESSRSDDCFRDCDGNERVCQYELNISMETSMSLYCGECPFVGSDCEKDGCIPGGGLVRPVIVANSRLPGPPIMVCENDTIVVKVTNNLKTETTSIHWHGIHQVGTFFMDGLPSISQFPLSPSATFTYTFKASPHGTHMWHGHSSFQESDGLFGALIVRKNESEPTRSLYDFDLAEHTVLVWHWYNQSTADVLVPILHRNLSVHGFGLVINGKAAFKDYVRDGRTYNTPREVFRVDNGFRYRFRLIFNSAIYCPLQVSIDEHMLKVIASETSYFEPVDVDSLMVGPGDRFDFVLNADKVSGCYPMRFRGAGDCGPRKAVLVHEMAYICYGNTSSAYPVRQTYESADRDGILLNPFEKATYDYSNKTLVHLTELNSSEESHCNYSGTPDVTLYLEVQSIILESARFPGSWHQFNNITFSYPGVSFLRNKFISEMTCTLETRDRYCQKDFCSCTYLEKIPKNSLVEIVLVDINTEGIQDHPIHLHGYKFQIVAMDAIGDNVSFSDIKEQNENGLLKKNLHTAISKDTVSVPNRGYAVLRFIANNPGLWLFHCHVTNHMELGMAMLLQVGSDEEILSMCHHEQQCGKWYNSSGTSHHQFNNLVLIIHILMFFHRLFLI